MFYKPPCTLASQVQLPAMANFAVSARFLALMVCFIIAPSVAMGNTTRNSTMEFHSPVLEPSSKSQNVPIDTIVDKASILSTSSHAVGLGGFIAQRLGMSTSTENSITTTAVPTSTQQATINVISVPALNSTNLHTIGAITNTSDMLSNYHNLSYTGECWDQWNSFWTASRSLNTQDKYSFSIVSTESGTILWTEYSLDWSQSQSVTWTRTVTMSNGAFAQTTFTTVTEKAIAVTIPITTYETLQTSHIWSETTFDNPPITSPTCSLPAYLPACQSNWEAWISRDAGEAPSPPPSCRQFATSTAPSCSAPLSIFKESLSSWRAIAMQESPGCTQAVITGSYCSATVSSWLRRQKSIYGQWNGVVGAAPDGTLVTVNNMTVWSHIDNHTWDATRALVPGCTVGCQSCQIQGGTVQLIYWPPASSTWVNGVYTALTGNRTAKSTIVTLGTTLTSPTVYVSFDSLYARDSCSPFGKTYSNEIVAITDTATLKSIAGWNYLDFLGSTYSFNFTDLYVSPVPESIYQQQPRCASSWYHQAKNENPNLSAWTCPRLFPYEPILAIPDEVRHIDPGWADCIGSINGVYDPPSMFISGRKTWMWH